MSLSAISGSSSGSSFQPPRARQAQKVMTAPATYESLAETGALERFEQAIDECLARIGSRRLQLGDMRLPQRQACAGDPDLEPPVAGEEADGGLHHLELTGMHGDVVEIDRREHDPGEREREGAVVHTRMRGVPERERLVEVAREFDAGITGAPRPVDGIGARPPSIWMVPPPVAQLGESAMYDAAATRAGSGP